MIAEFLQWVLLPITRRTTTTTLEPTIPQTSADGVSGQF